MTEKTYNGWTNYETWVVNLWMDNDEPSYRHHKGMAQEAYDAAEQDKYFTREERATLDLSDMLKEEYEEAMYDLLEDHTASVWSNLLGAALSEVNWHEIAEHLIDDVDKEEVEEEEQVQ
jgi:hypothetical protein